MISSEVWWPVRRRLDRHLSRLRDNLEVLSERLREALASTVGKAVADAVREVVHRLISLAPSNDPRPSHYRQAWDRDERAEWDDRYQPPWQQNAYDDEEEDEYQNDEYEERPQTTPVSQAPPSHWLRSIQLGLQTAAWLLRIRLTRLPLASALGLGVFASAAACVSGPSVITVGASIVAGILSLLNLVDSYAAVAARNF